jgi:hypothetical protein
MRSRTIASIAITLLTAPSLQPLALAQLPGVAVAPGAQAATAPAVTAITGTALRTDLKPLPAATVRLRHFDTTSIVGTVTAGPSGEFVFPSVQAGNYLIELVDLSGRVVGMVPPFAVTGTVPVSVSVIASGSGVTPSSTAGGGFSLFGLGQTATLAVLGAAGAAAVTAVVSTKQDASPSR